MGIIILPTTNAVSNSSLAVYQLLLRLMFLSGTYAGHGMGWKGCQVRPTVQLGKTWAQGLPLMDQVVEASGRLWVGRIGNAGWSQICTR